MNSGSSIGVAGHTRTGSWRWRIPSWRSDHRADDHADDLPVLGLFVDHDRPVLGVLAARPQLDPVFGRPVKALQRDLRPDPGHHDVALGRVRAALDRDDVARPVANGRHAVAPYDHVEVRLGMDLTGQLVGHPEDRLALVGEDRRAGGHLWQVVGVEHGGPFAQELDAAVHPGVELDPALPLERLEVIGDRRPGDELQGARQVGARRRHPPLPDVLADVVQNLLLPFGEFSSSHSCPAGVDSAA